MSVKHPETPLWQKWVRSVSGGGFISLKLHKNENLEESERSLSCAALSDKWHKSHIEKINLYISIHVASCRILLSDGSLWQFLFFSDVGLLSKYKLWSLTLHIGLIALARFHAIWRHKCYIYTINDLCVQPCGNYSAIVYYFWVSLTFSWLQVSFRSSSCWWNSGRHNKKIQTCIRTSKSPI